MKRILSAVLLLSVAACSAAGIDESESLGESSENLNGDLSPRGFLVKKTIADSDETARESDTLDYYGSIGIEPDGSGVGLGGDFSALITLTKFRDHYFGSGSVEGAVYYNRGDLGLGRDMHCVDRFAIDGQIACYVTNYAAGDDGSEFTFGLSPDIAFRNIVAKNAVATVAMVYRDRARPGQDKVIFAVYNKRETLTLEAPLDRHGLNFFNEFISHGTPDPAVFGTPGVNFNNHIPSNCLNCHGGQYEALHHSVSGAFFLPFDLDQFEFKNEPNFRRQDQEFALSQLNEMARKVAYKSTNNVEHPVVRQIDGWYGNLQSRNQELVHDFDSSYVPDGWDDTADDVAVYRAVVRRSCRGCHVTSAFFPFETASDFAAFGGVIALDVGNHLMPHALQTQRQFWQSSQPLALENYFRVVGQSGIADSIKTAGPGRIITLDPPLILAATF